MKILFAVLFLLFVTNSFAAFSLGHSAFYADVLLTNREYGTGAVFRSLVWYSSTLNYMRVDYYNLGGSKFMSTFYNYTSQDKYQICTGTCSRSTWNAPIPLFSGTNANFASLACETPDWPGPRACVSNCNSFKTNPLQTTGIWSLSYNDTLNTKLCLARWTPAQGFSYGPEWHVQIYKASGWTTAENPTLSNTYSSVIAGANCPAPVCKSVLDIALVIDESGSITGTPSYWQSVVDFTVNLVSALDVAPGAVRAGVIYFSGIECNQNFTGTTTVSCNGNCGNCGGLWQYGTSSLIDNKSSLLSTLKSRAGRGGWTCISCGLDEGIKMLNLSPKQDVQKIIILMTDGSENRVSGKLVTMHNYALYHNIRTIAVGVGGYVLSQLQEFGDQIFTVAQFSQLSSLIDDLTRSVCQALPSIETCDFCSGICSCQTTCNCPVCDDYNKCTNERCDVRPPPDGTLGVCVSTPVTCDDNNKCTQNLCSAANGCYYTVPTVAPADFNYCLSWGCDAQIGFQTFDNSTARCPASTDKCVINYCNYTVGTTGGLRGSCVSLNKSQIASGTAVHYVNPSNQTIAVLGCAKPSGAPSCSVYSCNPSTGSCVIDNSACECQTNADCNDHDGCTNDVCDAQFKCVRTRIDCYSELSSGSCVASTTTVNPSTTTGNSYYNGTGTFPLVNGLPPIQSRTCDNLACYNGERSQYQCVSSGDNSHTCSRSIIQCTSTSCQDNVCRTTGGWTNGHINTDCGTTFSKSCNDNNLCTGDICSSTWQGVSCTLSGSCVSQSGGARCLNPSNSSNCNDNNVCTTDGCNPSTGCTFTTNPLPSNNCWDYFCDPVTGVYHTAKAGICTSNSLCNITYCDSNTQTCQFVDKNSVPLGTSVNFIDASGNPQTVAGCQKAPFGCLTYGCNATTGQCYVDSSSCACTLPNDPKCDDGNGCTVDSCETVNGVCINTPIDCWSELSSGTCIQNTPFTQTNATGWARYTYNIQNNDYTDETFVAGNYNCDKMACYGGLRSQYVCTSTSSSTHTCDRQTSPCSKGGCRDNICRSLGTWTNGQANTDCGASSSPTCNSDKCNVVTCNSGYVWGSSSLRCNTVNNATNCVDGNLCTVDGNCNPSTGCDYSTPTTQPQADTTCFTWSCNPTTGWSSTPTTTCDPNPTNLCQAKYCNTTLNQCVTINKDDIPRGSTVFYVDQFGSTKSVEGCGKPANEVWDCKSYSCQTSTGTCQLDTSACVCYGDSFCYDGDPCTVDTCINSGRTCNRVVVDCFSELSNGKCTKNSAFTMDTETGILVYGRNYTANNVFTRTDQNGLPSPANGVDRTCGQLGCYNGQRSEYKCFGTTEGSYTCNRLTLDCDLNGCKDTICRSLGTWTDGQMDTDCGTTYVPFCIDTDACTSDFCDVNWRPNQPEKKRCIHQRVNETSFCNDGNFCTRDFCDSRDTSGDACKHALYSQGYLKTHICNDPNKLGPCKEVSCTVNKCHYDDKVCPTNTLCMLFVCNSTTQGNCGIFPTGIATFDKCGVCGGNGLSCNPETPSEPKRTSIIVALAVGLTVGLIFAAIIIGILTYRGVSAYMALGTEAISSVTETRTYQDNENTINTEHYNRD